MSNTRGAIDASVVHGGRTWNVGQKLEHRKFFTNMLKNFTMRVPRVVVDFPSLEIFKTHLDIYLCDLMWESCFSGGVELNVL